MPIKTKIPTNEEVSYFKSLRCYINMLINVKMPTLVGILTFVSMIILCSVELSIRKFYNLGVWPRGYKTLVHSQTPKKAQ